MSKEQPVDLELAKRLKEEGAAVSFSRVPKKWFVKGDQDKNYFLCVNAVQNVSEESADNALKAMKNWTGIENLKNIKNQLRLLNAIMKSNLFIEKGKMAIYRKRVSDLNLLKKELIMQGFIINSLMIDIVLQF